MPEKSCGCEKRYLRLCVNAKSLFAFQSINGLSIIFFFYWDEVERDIINKLKKFFIATFFYICWWYESVGDFWDKKINYI